MAGRAPLNGDDRGHASTPPPTDGRDVPPPALARSAAELGSEVLAALIDRSPEGVVVLDEDLELLYLNDAATTLLGVPPERAHHRGDLTTVPAPARATARESLLRLTDGTGGSRGTGTIIRPDGEARQIDYAPVTFESEGQRVLVGLLRDITDSRPGRAREQAFAGIAATVAFAESLDDTLDRLAERVVEATSMRACAVTVFDEERAALRVAGTCGLPANYPHRFQAARRSGAVMPAIAAVIDGESTVVRQACDDPALDPDGSGHLVDATLLCLPMSARGRTVGALELFYGADGVPDPDGMRFLSTVADQAAIAVDNARWFARACELQRRQVGLIQAGLTLATGMPVPAVLRNVVDLACKLAGARYGEVVLSDDDRQPDWHDVVVHGAEPAHPEVVIAIGRRLVSEVLLDGRPARAGGRLRGGGVIAGEGCDVPVPPLLAIPISRHEQHDGAFYVCGKDGEVDPDGFSDDDEASLLTLAAQAAAAIERSRSFEQAQERLASETRHRLARELHDSVSQAVFSMTLETRAAQLAMEAEGVDPDGPVGVRLTRLRELTRGALAEMRALIFELRPEALREEGLIAGLEKHGAGISARSGLVVDIDAEPFIDLPPGTEEQLYRVAQEALNNTANHADAHRVTVRLTRVDDDPAAIVLRVHDDGIGFDPSRVPPGHLGLTTMRQRAERLGGTFTVESAAGQGTAVQVVIPVATIDDEHSSTDDAAPSRHPGRDGVR